MAVPVTKNQGFAIKDGRQNINNISTTTLAVPVTKNQEFAIKACHRERERGKRERLKERSKKRKE